MPFMGSSINVALPYIGHEFSLHAIELGWVASSFLLAAAIVLLPLGRAGDLYGRKRLFTRGLVLYFGASLLCAFSWSGAGPDSHACLAGNRRGAGFRN